MLAYFPTARLWTGAARALPWLAVQRSPGHYFDIAHFWFAVLFALGLVSLQRRFAKPRSVAWITAAIAAAVVVDFWPSRVAFSRGFAMEDLRRAGEAVRTLPGEGGTLRIGTPFPVYSPAASWIVAQATVGHAWGWLDWQAGGHWFELIDPPIAASSTGAPLRNPTRIPLFEAARVRYWLRPNNDEALPAPWRQVRSDHGFAIWEQPGVSPMAAGFRAVWSGDTSRDPASLVRIAWERNTLVIAGRGADGFPPPPADPERSDHASAPLPVAYHRPKPEHIQLDVDAAAEPAMILVSESHHPWWRATVDGAAAPVLRAQLALMAVPVGPGTHRIDLSLERPVLVAVADRLTALSWIALALAAPIALIRSRQGKR